MSVTITSVSPTAGHTGGRTLVEIDGTGFVVPVGGAGGTPGADGLVPKPPPTVAVLFGTVPALDVVVLSATELYAVAPPQSPLPDGAGRLTAPRTVDVTVTNIDASGHPLAGQTATFAAAYTYQLPDLTSVESDLARCVRTWLQLLKAQVTPNVSWPKSTDFDQDTADFLSITDLPALPGLVVAALTVRANDFYAVREPVQVDNGDGTFTEKAPPDTVDLVMTIVGVSNNPVELLNLTAAFKRFLRKNPRVIMQRDPGNAGLGTVSYGLNWWETKEVAVTSTANASNLAHFAYAVAIEGFDIEDMPGLPAGGPGDTGRAHEATIAVTSEAETVTILGTPRLP